MTKGKYRRRQERRRDRADTMHLSELREDLAAETRRAEAARLHRQLAASAAARLWREQSTTGKVLQHRQQAAQRLCAAAAAAHAPVLAALRQLRAADHALTDGPVKQRIHQATQIGDRIRVRDVHPSASDALLRTRLRGHLEDGQLPTRAVTLAGWIPDTVPADRTALHPYATSTVTDITAQASWAWTVPPWLRLPHGDDAAPLRAELGTTTAGTPQLEAGFPGPGLPAAATIDLPWRHLPPVTRPGDAADLAHWYHRSAYSQNWQRQHRPVPFWLPPEHATAYPQARTLSDSPDLRLPFRLVFAAFGTPWRIEPSTGQQPEHFARLLPVVFYARGHTSGDTRSEQLHDVLARLQSTGLTDRNLLPTPLEALHHYGGTVEGLLLTADENGHPGNHLAWCVAVYHPLGFPIARVAVPALRDRTAWSRPVDNIIAGIALSCWHHPDDADPANVPSPRHPEPAAAISGVHVLDIDATSPTRTRPHPDTLGPSPRPHLRRGHWRELESPPAGRTTPWTWIRPTSVNGLPAAVDQIYTLTRTHHGTTAA